MSVSMTILNKPFWLVIGRTPHYITKTVVFSFVTDYEHSTYLDVPFDRVAQQCLIITVNGVEFATVNFEGHSIQKPAIVFEKLEDADPRVVIKKKALRIKTPLKKCLEDGP